MYIKCIQPAQNRVLKYEPCESVGDLMVMTCGQVFIYSLF